MSTLLCVGEVRASGGGEPRAAVQACPCVPGNQGAALGTWGLQRLSGCPRDLLEFGVEEDKACSGWPQSIPSGGTGQGGQAHLGPSPGGSSTSGEELQSKDCAAQPVRDTL